MAERWTAADEAALRAALESVKTLSAKRQASQEEIAEDLSDFLRTYAGRLSPGEARQAADIIVEYWQQVKTIVEGNRP